MKIFDLISISYIIATSKNHMGSIVMESEPIGLEEQFFMYFGAFIFISLIITIIYSLKNGGLKETIENFFLWVLLTSGLAFISLPPVEDNDEIAAGVFFIAFGICRMAKHISKKD